MAKAIKHAYGTGLHITSKRFATPEQQAYEILHWGYVAAPLIAGADKFLHLLGNWEQYLAPIFPRMLGLTPTTFMYLVGAIEIAAAGLVAFRPRWGAYVVALWLFGIIGNLLILGQYLDIAFRDFGLSLGALALARLSVTYDAPQNAPEASSVLSGDKDGT